MNKNKSSAGTVGFIFIAMLLAKILGQVREIVIAYTYGTAWQADSYVAASQIPTNFFDMILGSAVSAAFIPVFNKFLEKEGEKRAKRFAGSFFNVIILICICISALGMVFAPWLIGTFTPGLDAKTATLATQLLRIMFPMIIFIGTAFTFVGVLQSMGHYNLPAVMSMVSSGICIVYLFTLEDKFGIIGLSVSLVLGWALQALVLTPSTFKVGFRLTPHIADPGLKEVVKIALPVLVGTWVQPINVLVNTWIASSTGGGVSAINYANKLYIIAAGVFAMSVTNYIFPKLSRLSISSEDKENWFDMFYSSLKTVILVVTPIAIVFLTQSRDIIKVIYQRGEFGEESVIATSGALLFYSIGILPYALQEVMYKSFYSRRNSVIPMIVAIIGILVNLVLSFTLSRFMGINGLALAASLSVIITVIVSFVLITKNSGKAFLFLKSLIKIVFIGIISAGTIILFKNILGKVLSSDTFINRALILCIPAAAGCVVYLLLALFFKIPEVTGIINMFLKKGEKNEK